MPAAPAVGKGERPGLLHAARESLSRLTTSTRDAAMAPLYHLARRDARNPAMPSSPRLRLRRRPCSTQRVHACNIVQWTGLAVFLCLGRSALAVSYCIPTRA